MAAQGKRCAERDQGRDFPQDFGRAEIVEKLEKQTVKAESR